MNIILAIWITSLLFSGYMLIRNHFTLKLIMKSIESASLLAVEDINNGQNWQRWYDIIEAKSYNSIMWRFAWTVESVYPEIINEWIKRHGTLPIGVVK